MATTSRSSGTNCRRRLHSATPPISSSAVPTSMSRGRPASRRSRPPRISMITHGPSASCTDTDRPPRSARPRAGMRRACTVRGPRALRYRATVHSMWRRDSYSADCSGAFSSTLTRRSAELSARSTVWPCSAGVISSISTMAATWSGRGRRRRSCPASSTRCHCQAPNTTSIISPSATAATPITRSARPIRVARPAPRTGSRRYAPF